MTREARIFDVVSNFQKKARQPGGLTREKAIARAQAKLDQDKPNFIRWLGEELDALRLVIRQAEKNSADTSSLEQATYHARQLRDVGSTMGFNLVTFVAANLCNILDAIKAGARYDKEVIDCHLGALALASQLPYQNVRPEELPELSGGLRSIFEKLQQPDGAATG